MENRLTQLQGRRTGFDLLVRQERLQILYRDIESARKVLDLAQTRLDRGLTNELDVLLAKRQVETLEADGEPLKALIASNGYAIAVLVGEYPKALARDLRRLGATPRLPARAPVGLPVDLLRRRPDIREAERFLAAAVADIGARTADLFLSLVITAAAGAQGDPRSGSAIPITWIDTVGPSIDAPILDWRWLAAGRNHSTDQASGSCSTPAVKRLIQDPPHSPPPPPGLMP
jgi:outer membrane protein TolC